MNKEDAHIVIAMANHNMNELGDKGDKGECFYKDFFQIGVF